MGIMSMSISLMMQFAAGALMISTVLASEGDSWVARMDAELDNTHYRFEACNDPDEFGQIVHGLPKQGDPDFDPVYDAVMRQAFADRNAMQDTRPPPPCSTCKGTGIKPRSKWNPFRRSFWGRWGKRTKKCRACGGSGKSGPSQI